MNEYVREIAILIDNKIHHQKTSLMFPELLTKAQSETINNFVQFFEKKSMLSNQTRNGNDRIKIFKIVFS